MYTHIIYIIIYINKGIKHLLKIKLEKSLANIMC